ncbi:unnamed protein product [Lota lota]
MSRKISQGQSLGVLRVPGILDSSPHHLSREHYSTDSSRSHNRVTDMRRGNTFVMWDLGPPSYNVISKCTSSFYPVLHPPSSRAIEGFLPERQEKSPSDEKMRQELVWDLGQYLLAAAMLRMWFPARHA